MGNAIELLRNLAGVIFWGLTDLFLGACLFALIFGFFLSVIKGFRKDE